MPAASHSGAPTPTRRGWGRLSWPWLIGGFLVVGVAGATVWLLLASSLLSARSVEVAGTAQLSADTVRAVAAVPLGTPMVRLDTQAIQRRVAALPAVASVDVHCQLNGTVRIEVTERTPVAVIRDRTGTHLVDATGADYAVVAVAPPGLPELRVSRASPHDSATVAALEVLTGLPPWLRGQVRTVGADSPAGVLLRLGNGREVRWGGVEDTPRKAAVLAALLTQPGRVYDVSSPTLPTVS